MFDSILGLVRIGQVSYLSNSPFSTCIHIIIGWIMFAVSGVMQAILLIMCIAWKIRQRRLNIDDFGHPLYPTSEDSDPSHTNVHGSSQESEHGEEQAPLTTEELAQAIIDERAPLLRNDSRAGSKKRKLSSLLRVVRK